MNSDPSVIKGIIYGLYPRMNEIIIKLKDLLLGII
jgi:hypothetical protein